MSVSVVMPQLGESVTEGTVTRWLKKEGEHVSADEPLLEVSTDKVDTEIPSPASGVLRGIAVDEDETVAVGAQLAVIEDSESADAPAPAAAPSAPAAAPPPPRGPPPPQPSRRPRPSPPRRRRRPRPPTPRRRRPPPRRPRPTAAPPRRATGPGVARPLPRPP